MAEEEEKMDLPGQVKDGEDDYDSADMDLEMILLN